MPGRIPRIAIVGCGNVGGRVAAHLAAGSEPARVLCIDPDRFEPRDVAAQGAGPGDVGHNKARATARRLAARAPRLAVEAHPVAVESLPAGRLRGATVVCGVDSRLARTFVNELALGLGLTWIDAALDAARGLVRVRTFVAGRTACLECGWGRADRAALEARAHCLGPARAAPTGVAPELGALAASLASLELRACLAGRPRLAGRQLFLEPAAGRADVVRYARRRACLADHRRWRLEPLALDPTRATFADLLALAPGGAAGAVLGVPGQRFVRRLRCPGCGRAGRAGLRLSGRIPVRALRCASCGGPRMPGPHEIDDALVATRLARGLARRRLASAGLVPGDVVALGGAGRRRVRHCVIEDVARARAGRTT